MDVHRNLLNLTDLLIFYDGQVISLYVKTCEKFSVMTFMAFNLIHTLILTLCKSFTFLGLPVMMKFDRIVDIACGLFKPDSIKPTLMCQKVKQKGR